MSLRSLDSNDLNTSYMLDLKNLAYGSIYDFILKEDGGRGSYEGSP